MSWDRTKGRPEPIRALNRIREIDNGEPLVDIQEGAPHVVIMRDSVIPFLRQTVVAMLDDASRRLPEGYKLGVIDAWRPYQRQVRIFEWMWKSLQEARPDLPYSAQRRMICRFVAPTDQKAPPGHCTGAAVDVNLLGPDGKIVDVAAPFTDRLRGAPTYVFGLEPEAHRHRFLLFDAMSKAGFSNCRDEWWHYSYGDAGWAVRTGEKECMYGLVELPPELYEAQEEEWLSLISGRPNPFLESGAPGQGRRSASRSAGGRPSAEKILDKP